MMRRRLRNNLNRQNIQNRMMLRMMLKKILNRKRPKKMQNQTKLTMIQQRKTLKRKKMTRMQLKKGMILNQILINVKFLPSLHLADQL